MARRKVLILEDDLAMADLYSVTLTAAGMEVTICNTFPEARNAVHRELPDVVLTDVRVGEFNGFQLAHLFRAMSPEGMILVVTGHDDPTMRAEAGKLGASFLLKPVNMQELVSRLSAG
jgi:two-component system, response regulator RegA